MICIGILALIILGIDIYLNDKEDLVKLYLWMKRTAGSLKAKLRGQKRENIEGTIRGECNMANEVREIKEDDISLGRHFAIWSGYDGKFMDYDGLGFSRNSIEDYVKKNPFPKDKHYLVEDMIYDFTKAGGSITMRCEKEETADWVVDMINALL